MKSFILSTLTVIISGAVAFGVCEAAYRIYLVSVSPDEFVSKGDDLDRPSVWFMEKSRWIYNREYGYEYGPETIFGGSAANGKVQSCWSWPANRRGNMGLIRGEYKSADLKILILGDSFTAQIDTGPDPRGITWPDYLQDYLTQAIKRSVHVLNFARDGTGLLHMMDLAQDVVLEWKPDLVIFSFITDDLTRDRFWRTQTVIDGRERVLTTMIPDPDPPLSAATDTAVVHSGATRMWCARERDKAGQSDDKILRAMEEIILAAKARRSGKPSPMSLDRSFLIDRIRHGTPFHSTYAQAAPTQNPRHKMNSFLEDKRFVEGLDRIKKLKIPTIVAHLSTFNELERGVRMIGGDQDKNLVRSLSEAFERPVLFTADYFSVDPKRLSEIKRSPNDTHPSVFGMRYYARAVTEALLKHKIVRP